MPKESEETEVKKDLEWLKEEIKNNIQLKLDHRYGLMSGEYIGTHMLEAIIYQLDEPEVLSQEWIDENEEQEEMYGSYGVPVHKLQNLLVPKQELPVVPTWFDKWWKDVYKGEGNLLRNIDMFHDKLYSYGTREMYNYISTPDNKKKLLNIIINELDYVVEKEQKYYVLDKEGATLLRKSEVGEGVAPSIGANIYNVKRWENEGKYRLTEQEIKDYDPRYMAFAKPVEELEE